MNVVFRLVKSFSGRVPSSQVAGSGTGLTDPPRVRGIASEVLQAAGTRPRCR